MEWWRPLYIYLPSSERKRKRRMGGAQKETVRMCPVARAENIGVFPENCGSTAATSATKTAHAGSGAWFLDVVPVRNLMEAVHNEKFFRCWPGVSPRELQPDRDGGIAGGILPVCGLVRAVGCCFRTVVGAQGGCFWIQVRTPPPKGKSRGEIRRNCSYSRVIFCTPTYAPKLP